MLDKNDLNKITEIVRVVVDERLDAKIDAKLEAAFEKFAIMMQRQFEEIQRELDKKPNRDELVRPCGFI